jgi:hypothetical protein
MSDLDDLTNLEAARRTVAGLPSDHQDTAAVVAFLSLARAVDNDERNASLWARYLEALEIVAGLNDSADDAFGVLLMSLQQKGALDHAARLGSGVRRVSRRHEHLLDSR